MIIAVAVNVLFLAFSKAQPDLSRPRTSDKIDIPDSKQGIQLSSYS